MSPDNQPYPPTGDEPEDNDSTAARNADIARALIPAYGLGAADPDEKQFVETHMSDELQAELAEFTRLADAMLFSVPEVAPPPELHGRLMTAIGAGHLVAPASGSGWSFRMRVLVRAMREQKLATALTAAALLLLVLTNVLWASGYGSLASERDALASQTADQEALIRAFGSPQIGHVELAAEGLTPQNGPHASVSWATTPDHRWIALLSAQHLPALELGEVYQLWLVRGGKHFSAGIFQIDMTGDGTMIFYTNEPIGTYDSLGITQEPEGGSTEPTTLPVVIGNL